MIQDVWQRLALLTPRERARWAALLPIGVATAVLEATAAALVYGLIAVWSDARGVDYLPRVAVASVTRLGGGSLVIGFTLVAAGALLLRNSLILVVAAFRARTAGDTAAALSTRVLRAYLTAPYVFHLRRNSAGLAQNVIVSIPALLGLVDALTILATELLVVVTLLLLLGIVAPLETLVATLVIVAPLVVFVRLSRRAYHRYGARNYELGLLVHAGLQQALGAIKEVKVFGRERFFYEALAHKQEERARIGMRHAALENVPRLLAETAFVLGMLALVLLLHARSPDGGFLLPFVGLYAYVGFRVIPAAHRIALQVGLMRYSLAATASLCADVAALGHDAKRMSEPSSRTPAFRSLIRFERVSFAYDGQPAILQDVDLAIRPGECVGVVGATGAGKSTLVDLLLGLLRPTSGRITVDASPLGEHMLDWRQQIGYVPQAPVLLDDTLRRNVAFGLADDDIDEARVKSAVHVAQLEDLVDSLPDRLETVVGERGIRLSGGERQRVSIARALYHDPDVLVFDEATSSLDPGTERELTRAIERFKGRKTLLIIAHRLTTIERCDRLVLICDGRVAADGPYDQLSRTSPAFRAMAAMPEPVDSRPA